MQICFDELRRAQEVSPRPNFLVLLGDRYGWQPLAETITEVEFQELETNAGELDRKAGRGLQADDSATETLRTWYRRDDNAVPVEYQLRSRNDWPGLPEWTEEGEVQAWKKVEETLWSVINLAYPQEGLAGRFGQILGAEEPLLSIVKFQASATEQEIWRGALAVPDALEHVVTWYRTIRNREQYQHDPRANDFLDLDEALRAPAAALKEELKRRLRQNGRPDIQPVEVELKESADCEKLEVTHDHLQPMCNEIETRMREIIDEEIRTYWKPLGDAGAEEPTELEGPSEARKLELEIQAHELFGESRAPKDGFVGRDQELKAIADYLSNEEDHNPLVVHGPSGTGKTALLARAAHIASENYKGRIFLRFLGTTPQSSNLNALLSSLCRELRQSEERANDLPIELQLLQDEFDRLLALATTKEPILLFLDALDQLDEADGARQAYWLRTPLPPHVKVVVSCILDEEGPAELNESYRSFERRKLLDRAIAVESLTANDAIRAIGLWLQNGPRRPGHRRQLTTQQREAIAARVRPDSAAACRRPLYLHILFEECRLWPSWKMVESADLGEDTAALLKGLFDRLFQPVVHGAMLVESALSYIASARRGLSESEILELLWADSDYRQFLEKVSLETNNELPPGATRIPIAIWSRLRHDLDPYLSERDAPGAVVLGVYHREVERVVRESFLGDGARQILRHGRLAEYFQNNELQPWWRPTDGTVKSEDGAPRTRLPNARRASELPWALQQVAKAADSMYKQHKIWDPPANLLCDIEFVQAKCSAGLVFELQEDYKLLEQSLPEAQAELAEKRRYDSDVARWTSEMITYSAAWSDRRKRKACGEGVIEPEPALPASPNAVRIRTDDEIVSECSQVCENPSRQDRVHVFAEFVQGELYSLLEFGDREGFVLQHAHNYAPGGPVHDGAKTSIEQSGAPMLIRRWSRNATWNPRSALMRTLEGHLGYVDTVSVTSDGRRAVSGGSDTMLKVWDLDTGACVRTLKEHPDRVSCVNLTFDGRRAITQSIDRSLRVWNLDTGECLSTLQVQDQVHGVDVTHDGSQIFSEFWPLVVMYKLERQQWDQIIGSDLRRLIGPIEPAGIFAVAPDGVRAISISHTYDCDLRLWNLESFANPRNLKWQDLDVGAFQCVALTIDGRQAVSGHSDGRLAVWDLESGTCLKILQGHKADVCSVSLTADGSRAVSGSLDSTLRVWDLDTGSCVRVLNGHSDGVLSVCVTPDGRRAVSGSRDQTLRVWDLENGISRHGTEHHDQRVVGVVPLPSLGIGVSGYGDATYRVWHLKTAECLRTLKIGSDRGMNPCLTPDGRYGLSSRGTWIEMLDLRTGSTVDLTNHSGWEIDKLNVTADGRLAVTARKDKTLKGEILEVWDLKTITCTHILKGFRNEISCTCFSQDGRWVIAGSFGRMPKKMNRRYGWRSPDTLRIWDLKSNVRPRTVKGLGLISSIEVTVDSRRMVVWGSGQGRSVCDLRTGICLQQIGSPIGRMRLVPNGVRMVSADGVWDLETGRCLQTLNGHRKGVVSLSVSPDGRYAISAGEDSWLKIWHLDSGACVICLHINGNASSSAFHSGVLMVGTMHGEVQILEARNLQFESPLSIDCSDIAYESSLRRGLDFCVREYGVIHQRTLAHRAVLAVHLRRIGVGPASLLLRLGTISEGDFQWSFLRPVERVLTWISAILLGVLGR